MRYVSTRGQAPAVSFLDAILAGLAPDGGLYVPETWPNLNAVMERAATQTYARSARGALQVFAEGDLDGRDAQSLSGQAYAPHAQGASSAWHPAVTPLTQAASGEWILELFHGPSLSFKDVAMQLIGPLYDLALSRRARRLSVVCATSGDTGGAAVEALKGRERVDLFVLLPKGRVSEVQRRFMTASGAENVRSIEIDGDFDACQAIVKAMFADRDFATRAQLSGVNSINWARIVAQSVYFWISARTLGAPGPVNFVVPTGNFGDAFSAYVAMKTGAPIQRIVLATNSNDILARALESGRYQRAAQSNATLSPAMDIQVASNFERILFEALDRDGDAVRRLYETFAQSDGFDIPESALKKLRDRFSAHAVSDEETRATMKARAHDATGYLACPHTAVGLRAQAKLDAQLGKPCITLATAHPAKFPETVEAATGIRPELPARCADLFQRPEQFDTLPADAEAVKKYIRERSRAWS